MSLSPLQSWVAVTPEEKAKDHSTRSLTESKPSPKRSCVGARGKVEVGVGWPGQSCGDKENQDF